MLRTKHLKMAVVPMTLLALLSTAVPVASAQETTDESFYELTTTPSGGDMIVGEPGTTILFDSSNGELVDVLPPSEAEDYSMNYREAEAVTVSCFAERMENIRRLSTYDSDVFSTGLYSPRSKGILSEYLDCPSQTMV